jgi:carboxylesterase type B
LGPGVGFTPVVDGEYIQDLPYVLYKQGRLHKEVKQVISGNLINEGMSTTTDFEMPEKFPMLVRNTIPGADDETVELIRSLYDYPPENPDKLAWDWTTDMLFACNAYNIAKAYEYDAKRYVMTIPPAIHGQDLYCMPLDSLNLLKNPSEKRKQLTKLPFLSHRLLLLRKLHHPG